MDDVIATFRFTLPGCHPHRTLSRGVSLTNVRDPVLVPRSSKPHVSQTLSSCLSIKPNIKQIGQKMTEESAIKVGTYHPTKRCAVQTTALQVMFAPEYRITGHAYEKSARLFTRSSGLPQG